MSPVETTPPKSIQDVDAPPSTTRVPHGAPQVPPPHPVRVQPRPRRWKPGRVLRGLAVVLIVVVPAVGAALISARMAPTYGAEVEILYQTGDAGSPETVERELATQRVLLVSRPAIAAASQDVGRSPVEVAKHVKTEVLEGSNVIRLRATDTSARVARLLATSLAEQYIAVVQEKGAARLDQRRQAITAQIDAANARLAQINDTVFALSRGPAIQAGVGNIQLPLGVQAEVRSLETEAGVLRQQVADLQEQIVQLDADPAAAPQVARAEVVVEPMLLPEPVGPQPLRAAAAGGLVGLLLAFGLVTFLRHRRSADHPEAAVTRS
jgi:uncharacterized protein involved in exopolysaccharide biosynthesis